MIGAGIVTLRGFRPADLPFLVTMRQDLEIETAAHPGMPVPRAAGVFGERISAGHPAPSSGGQDDLEFVIAHVDDPETAIGVGGLYGLDHHNRTVEFGVTIGDRAHWRTGAGFDAHLALLLYAFDICGMQRVFGQVKSDNAGVLRLCDRLGMAREGILRRHRWRNGEHVDLIVFGLLSEEFDRSLFRWRDLCAELT